MNISGDTPGVDYVTYFTKQFPQDLASMASLRDELAIRQGALSAAEAAIADRKAAANELEAASAAFATAKADAAELNAATKEAAAKVKARETAVLDGEAALAVKIKDTETDLAIRLRACETLEARQTKLDADLADRQAKLNTDTTALNERVKAFQAKVANLTA